MIVLVRMAFLGLILAITGCASMLSGVGGTQSYACQAPIGAQCLSVSGVYARAMRGMSEVPRPPATNRVNEKAPATKVTTPSSGPLPVASSPIVSNPAPNGSAALRSPPRVLRLWIAPWEDTDGDLHDASVVHVVVDTGHWLIERIRPVPRNRLDGVKAPAAAPASTTDLPETKPAGLPAALTGEDAMLGTPVLPAAH